MQHPYLRGIRRSFLRLFPSHGYVAHALRTLPPVAASSIATTAMPLDLHVLSLPLAFILSQDQTLLCISYYSKLVPILFLLWNQRSRIFRFVLFACTCFPSTFSMNSCSLRSQMAAKKSRSFRNGTAKVILFFELPKKNREIFTLNFAGFWPPVPTCAACPYISYWHSTSPHQGPHQNCLPSGGNRT